MSTQPNPSVKVEKAWPWHIKIMVLAVTCHRVHISAIPRHHVYIISALMKMHCMVMVMIRVYVAIVRKFVNQDLRRILGNIFFSNQVFDRWNSLDQDTVSKKD